LIPLFYFGPIQYWKDIFQLESIPFYQGSSLPKKSYANRMTISTANGLQNLTVPILGGRGIKIPYSEIEISYTENWISQHKMALQSAYSKSPFYEYYIDAYHHILEKRHSNLTALNSEIFWKTMKFLKGKNGIMPSAVNADPTIPDPWSLYEKYQPNLYSATLEYPQVFRNKFDFQPDLSILDLLFNLGNESFNYLCQESSFEVSRSRTTD
jgi:hypothetical protein